MRVSVVDWHRSLHVYCGHFNVEVLFSSLKKRVMSETELGANL